MKSIDKVHGDEVLSHDQPGNDLARLLKNGRSASFGGFTGAEIGVLLALKDDGLTALVTHTNHRGPSALSAKTTVELRAVHIGRQVLLVFENAEPSRPIIVGIMLGDRPSALLPTPGSVDIDVDGERLTVTAKDQLVLRCGSASITLTKDGEVSVKGSRISTHASGVNRIKGGSVQIN